MLEYEIESCPSCGHDAAVLYSRVRDGDGRVRSERRERVTCRNPACPRAVPEPVR
jgi:hypothetical protein